MENTAYITVGSRATVDAKDTRHVDVCGDYLYCYGCGQVLPKEEFCVVNKWHRRYCASCNSVFQRIYYTYRKHGLKPPKIKDISKETFLSNEKRKKSTRKVNHCEDYLHCHGCGEELPKSEFNVSNGWYNRYCRVCQALNQRMYSEKKESGGKFTVGSIPREIYLRNKKMKKQRIDEAKILAQKPTSNYAVCVHYSSCVHGSLVRKRCGIKHHKSKGCKLYDEFLGYAYTVSLET